MFTNSHGSFVITLRLTALILIHILRIPLLAEAPPNIILFYVDDLGWSDVGYQGSTFYETPHIDQLASEGIRFTSAYSPCPVCSPSRASLMTGKSTARVGFTGHITAIGRHRYPAHGRIIPPEDHMQLPLEEISLARALKSAGYVSASIGKWHLGAEGYWPLDHGFDVNVAGYTQGMPASYFFPYRTTRYPWNPVVKNLVGGKEGEYLTDRLTDEAIRFMDAHHNRQFFLYLTHYAVHTPIEAPRTLIDKYKEKLKIDDSQFNAGYAAMIETVDNSVGRIMEALERLKIDKKTIVIFSSDNGGESQVTNNRPLRAGKGYLYEGGIRVPLVLWYPGVINKGSVTDIPVIGTDLYPTITELAGEKSQPGKQLDGHSLVSLFTDPSAWSPRDLFWYYPHYSPQAKRPGSAIRSGKYKLIENYDPPSVELYDLAIDQGETINLAEKMPDRAIKMGRKIHTWLQESGAKLHRKNPSYQPESAFSKPPSAELRPD